MRLFRAYWVDGLDIGHPEVLRVLLADTTLSGHSSSQPLQEWGYAVTSARGPVTTVAYRLITGWRQQWRSLGAPLGPALVDDDHGVTTGRDALAQLERRLTNGDDEQNDHHDLPALPSRQPTGAFWT